MGHIEETMPNGPLKFLIFKYEVLQLEISNSKSTDRLILENDKSAKLGNALLDNPPLHGPSNYKMNSHNELVSQKVRRVKLMGLQQHLKRWSTWAYNGFVRKLHWMAEFFY